MNKENQSDDVTNLGLKKLSEEDIIGLSEEIYEFARSNLRKRVQESKVDFYDIVIDVDNSTENLQISVDIIRNVEAEKVEKEEELIKEILAETFSDLDKLLEEKFTS
ncbi:MAG: DUF3194 domain-containing protein [Candidatus Heimdallarchaeota archaeon]